AYGGAIYTEPGSTVSIISSPIHDNDTTAGDGGDGIADYLAGNGSAASGCAILSQSNNIFLGDFQMYNNQALAGAGGVSGTGDAANDGTGGIARGGAVATSGAMEIANVTIADNVARGGDANLGSAGDAFGGAVINFGTLAVSTGGFNENQAIGG